MKYEASEPDSFHRSLDAAMAKGRLVSTRDALAKALREHMSQGTSGRWIAEFGENPDTLASSLLASERVVDVATLADDDALVVAVCEAIDPNWNKGAAVVERTSLDRAARVLRALAAALTEPRP